MTSLFSPSFDILGIGEVLVGFHDPKLPHTAEHAVISGDIFNTLSACNAIGLKTALLSAIGTDEWTDKLSQALMHNNIDTQFVTINKNASNGLYWVPKESGHRFHYNRSESAFSKLPKPTDLNAIICKSKIIYATGITSALSEAMYQTVLDSFKTARTLDVKTVFDLNYRPNLWQSNNEAQEKLKLLFPCIDLFLPSLEDMELLYNIQTIDEAVSLLHQLPCSNIFLKADSHGVFKITQTGYEKIITPIHKTTSPHFIGAGDVANAFFIENLLKTTVP